MAKYRWGVMMHKIALLAAVAAVAVSVPVSAAPGDPGRDKVVSGINDESLARVRSLRTFAIIAVSALGPVHTDSIMSPIFIDPVSCHRS